MNFNSSDFNEISIGIVNVLGSHKCDVADLFLERVYQLTDTFKFVFVEGLSNLKKIKQIGNITSG